MDLSTHTTTVDSETIRRNKPYSKWEFIMIMMVGKRMTILMHEMRECKI
jgi:hypothetical protein